jgi:hypothetical protein
LLPRDVHPEAILDGGDRDVGLAIALAKEDDRIGQLADH